MIVKYVLRELNVLYLRKDTSDDGKVTKIINLFFKSLFITSNEDEAQELIDTNYISLILVDIDFKEKDGIVFVKYIRKTNANVPIIIITKNRELDNLLEAVKLNLGAYLLKPLDINVFINTLNEVSKYIVDKKEIISIKNGKIKYNHFEKKIHKQGVTYKLTKNEARLLELFLANKNKVIKKQDIKKIIWQDKNISESGFKSLMKRFMNKLGQDVLENAFGIGYVLKD